RSAFLFQVPITIAPAKLSTTRRVPDLTVIVVSVTGRAVASTTSARDAMFMDPSSASCPGDHGRAAQQVHFAPHRGGEMRAQIGVRRIVGHRAPCLVQSAID